MKFGIGMFLDTQARVLQIGYQRSVDGGCGVVHECTVTLRRRPAGSGHDTQRARGRELVSRVIEGGA